MWDHAQPAGHPQVDDDGGVFVQIDNEVLGPPADTTDSASRDSGQHVFDPIAGQDLGKIADTQRADALTDNLVDQGSPDGFDLGKFWHTRRTVARFKGHG